jgi:hypothetical protein
LKKATLSILAGVLMLVTLCMFPFSANAAETVSVSIPVEIEGGGTAIVITEVNCPLPKESHIVVNNGTTENINIVFTEPGDYSYTIETKSKKKSYYTPEYYNAAISVMINRKGKLTATVVLTKANSGYKPDVCRFSQAKSPSNRSSETMPTDSVVPTQPSKDPPVSRPKTGDDSMLDIYLLICIAASGGLFMLSVVYFISTNRMIERKKAESIQ